MRFSSIAAALLGLASLAACSHRSASAGPTAEASDFEWRPAPDPAALGWSLEGLARLRALTDTLETAAFMLVTDGRVVAAWGDTATNFRSHSMRKSMMSALYGIYVAEGQIDTAQTLADLGIDDQTPLTVAEKQARVSDLLRARSGVYIPAAAEVTSMREARPERGSRAPGEFWYYNNWDFNVLGAIFEQETGLGIFEAFERRIAGPLGMEDYRLDIQSYSDEPGYRYRAYGFRMSARDYARFALMYLDGGRWGGRQIVPADWVQLSTQPLSETGWKGPHMTGYGLMWWVVAPGSELGRGPLAGAYSASGLDGQKITVIPKMNSVVVHLLDTNRRPRRVMDTADYEKLLRLLVQARI